MLTTGGEVAGDRYSVWNVSAPDVATRYETNAGICRILRNYSQNYPPLNWSG